MASYLAGKSVDVFTVANLGICFTRALDAKGIRHVEGEGIVGDIAKNLAAQFGTEV